MEAVVCASNTGSTEHYAKLLGHELSVPVYSTEEAEKALEKKTDRTPEEEDMLDMMLHGGERVRIQNLQGVISWYNGKR